MNSGRFNRERSRSNSFERRNRSFVNDQNKHDQGTYKKFNADFEKYEDIDLRSKHFDNSRFYQNKKYSSRNPDTVDENYQDSTNMPYYKNNNYNSAISNQNRSLGFMSNMNRDSKLQDQGTIDKVISYEPKNIKISFTYQNIPKNQDYSSKATEKRIPIFNSIRITDPRFNIFSSEDMQIEKLNLILDLDETLVNSVPHSNCVYEFPASEIKEIIVQGHMAWIFIRPYTSEFLRELSEYFNIFAYSHGDFPYVEKVLELIDPDKKYFSRERIFKNMKQVTSKTCKSLKYLNFSDEEISKSIIVDDQRAIWEEESGKVIPLKKYVPFIKFMEQQKLQDFFLFNSGKDGRERYYLKQDYGDLESYIDKGGVRSYQLKSLLHLLKSIHSKYNVFKLRGQKTIPTVEDIYKENLKQILIDYEIEIMIESYERSKLFTELAKVLGARIVSIKEASKGYRSSSNLLLIVDKENYLKNIFYKRQVELMKQDNLNFKLVSAYWLIECFFSFSAISLGQFECKNL